MDLDDMPAVAGAAPGAAGGIPNDEYDTGAEANYDDQPFAALLAHGNWKARKAAYDRVTSGGHDVAPAAFADLAVPKAARELGSPAADSFVEALATLMENDSIAAACVAPATAVLVDKALVGRPRAAAAALRVLHSLTRGKQEEEVFAALAKGAAAKSPKARFAAASALSTLVETHGLAPFPPKPLLKAILPLFNDTDGKVRKEAMNVAVQCYRFIGDRIQPFLADLRDVQRQELTKLFEEVTPAAATASRRTNSPTQPASGPYESLLADNNFDDCDEVAVLPRLPGDFFAFTKSKTEKWQERAQRIQDQLLPLLSAPRITAAADYTELVKAIRDYISDAQLPITNLGYKCAKAIAQSLRVGLAPYARFLIPTLFDKLKEKKPTALEAANSCLDALIQFRCATPDQLFDDFAAACASKMPNHRQAAVQCATRMLAAASDPAQYSRLTGAATLLKKLGADDKVEVREATMALAAKIVELCGGERIVPFLQTLDDKQRAAVCGGETTTATTIGRRGGVVALDGEALQQQSGGGGGGGGFGSNPPSASVRSTTMRSAPASTSAAAGRSGAAAASTTSARPPTSTTARSRPGASAASSAATTPTAAGAAANSSKKAPQVLDEGYYTAGATSADEGARILDDTLRALDPAAADAIASLTAPEWRVRNDSATLVASAAQQLTPDMATLCAPAYLAVIRASGAKEGMFQVVNAHAKALRELFALATAGSYWLTLHTLLVFVPRLTEVKSRAVVGELLFALTELVGPKMVVRLMCAMAQEATNPKLLAEVLDWTDAAMQQFRESAIDAKALVGFVKDHVFEQANPAAKSAGVRVLVTLRWRSPPARVDGLLGDINPHLRRAYEAEVGREADAGRPAMPQRSVREPLDLPVGLAPGGARPAAAGPAAQQARQGRGAAGAAAADEDFPPTDIGAQLAAAVREMGNTSDWKIRSQGLRIIEDALVASSRAVAPTGVNDAFKALKARLDEPNKNFVTDVLRTICNLADAVVPASGAKFGLKLIYPSVVGMLGDQKSVLREEAVKVCSRAVTLVGLEPLLPPTVKGLTSDNQMTRSALVDMVVAAFATGGQHNSFAPKAMTPLVQPLLKLFVDRSSTVRAAAEAAFAYVLGNVGFDVVARAVTTFKPADQKLIGPALDRCRPVDEFHQQQQQQQTTGTASTLRRSDAVPRSSVALGGGGGGSHVDPMALQHAAEPVGAARPTSSAAAGRATAAARHQHPADDPDHASVAAPAAPPRHLPITPRSNVTLAEVTAGLRTARVTAVPQLCADLLAIAALDVMALDFHVVYALVERCRSIYTADDVSSDAELVAGIAAVNATRQLLSHPDFVCHLTAVELSTVLDVAFNVMTSAIAEQQQRFAAAAGADNGGSNVVASMNAIVGDVVQTAHADALLEALFGLLIDYCEEDITRRSTRSARFVQYVMRCMIRMQDLRRATSPDKLIVLINQFLTQFPPSRLQEHNERPLRYVKSMMITLVDELGFEAVLSLANSLVGQRTLVYGYTELLQRQHQQQQQQQAAVSRIPAAGNNGSGSAARTSPAAAPAPSNGAAPAAARRPPSLPTASSPQAAGGPSPQPVSSAATLERCDAVFRQSRVLGGGGHRPTTPLVPTQGPMPSGEQAALSNVQPNHAAATRPDSAAGASVSLIFAKARKAETSQLGLRELYQYVKTHPGCPDFDFHFNRCSDAFKVYLRTNLDKMAQADTTA